MKFAHVLLLSITVVAALGLTGCPPDPVNAIDVSNTTLDFARNTLPLTMFVWNSNTSFNSLAIQVRPRNSWISVSVPSVTSNRPGPGTVFDQQAVTVTVDRSQLSAGMHQGAVEFSAPGVVTVVVSVLVTQDRDGTSSPALSFRDAPIVTYGQPYLLEFDFTLQDNRGQSIVAEPNQFTVEVREGGTIVGPETPVHLRQGAARQLKIVLVLDYSLRMQQRANAIATMEDAAKNVLLPALNEDAQVAIVEFHADDIGAGLVTGFTVDKQFLRQRIDRIQADFVGPITSGARIWDAVVDAAALFGPGPSPQEARFIILFTDGVDTSSTGTQNDAVRAAQNRNVRIFPVGFGSTFDSTALRDVASRTRGQFFPVTSIGDLDDAFRDIVDNLGGQYTLRWITAKRNNVAFTPAFSLTVANATASFTSPTPFVPTQHAGDVRQGTLRFVSSSNEQRTTVFLRADFVPQAIRALRLFVASPIGFTVSRGGIDDVGLLQGWTLTTSQGDGGLWIEASTTGAAIPYATFGPMLRFDFVGVVPDNQPLFSNVCIDNSVYTAAQSFRILGFPDVCP